MQCVDGQACSYRTLPAEGAQFYIAYDTGQMNGKLTLHIRQGLGFFSSVQRSDLLSAHQASYVNGI
jgi:hypothetical protein